MATYNPRTKEDFRLEKLLAQVFENGLTGAKAIDQMRDLLREKGQWPPSRDSVPEEWENALLLRFFLGFKKNPDAAANAFGEMLEWRDKNGVNDIRKKILGGLDPVEFPRYEQVRRFYPLLKTGTDRNGSPINITLTGMIDPAKMIKTCSLDDIRLYIIYEMEYKIIKLSLLTAETGILYRALEVHDLKGLGMHHLATGPVGLLRKIVSEVSSNYVEMADKVLILNCPFATLVRGVLRQTLLDHADRKEYHECIFGGAMPEGLGELGGEDETLKWEAVTIPARDKKDVEQAVEAGQTVFYQVVPEALDIGVSIKFVAAAGGKTEQVFEPADRVSSLQRGSYAASEAGKLIMTLDNTFSYLKQKICRYDWEILQMKLDDKPLAGSDEEEDDDEEDELVS